MPYRTSVTALMLATALGMMIAEAQAWDDAKYVDLKGQWARTIGGAGRYDPSKPLGRLQEAPLAPQYGTGDAGRYDPTKPPGRLQEAPLTPEYQAIHEASLADQAQGGQGDDPTYRCLSPGMPRIMHAYSPMEVVVTPDTTHILIEHIHDNRRIHTDGRDWPADMDLNPMFAGYSIGRWIDAKGSGRYDTLLVETRGLKGPRTYEASGIPFHADGKTIIKERIYLDSANPNLLNDEITVIDHALTRPWTIVQNYRRVQSKEPIWWREDICAENNAHLVIGKEDYFLSADGALMPTRKDQPPPDLRYFKPMQRSGK